jgi:hypothetical protein
VYGIAAHLAAVQIGIGSVGEDPERLYDRRYGPERAYFNAAGTFNGHLVLVVPHPGVFLDATTQQFPEVPNTDLAVMPALGRLPSPDGLGPAIERPRETHIHFHGVNAAEVAAILADVNRDRG